MPVVRKPKKVSTCVRWSSTVLVMAVYAALGAVYVIPGLGIKRLAALTGVAEGTVTVGFGVRSIATLVVGNLTRNVFKTQMLYLGYGFVAVLLSLSTAAVPWMDYIYVLLVMFACHGMCFAYVKNTSRMILRDLWAQRFPLFIKVRNYHFLAGAMLGPFLSVLPFRRTPKLSPESNFIDSLTYFEIQYLMVASFTLISGFLACVALYCLKQEVAARKLSKLGKETVNKTDTNLTGTKLNTLPSFLRKLNFRKRFGFMKYFRKIHQHNENAETQGAEMGQQAGNVATGMAETVKEKVDDGIIEEKLIETEKSIVENNERVKSDNFGNHDNTLDQVAESIAEITTEFVKQHAEKSEIKEKPAEDEIVEESPKAEEPEHGKIEKTMNLISAGIDGITVEAVKPLEIFKVKKKSENEIEEEPTKVEEPRHSKTENDLEACNANTDDDGEDEDTAEDALEDKFQILLAILMSIVMGLSAMITYTNFIAKYLMTIGGQGLELSAITSMFNVCVSIGCSAVILLYRKYNMHKVLFVCSFVSTSLMVALCFYGQYYYVVWSLTAVFGIFAGKIQEGVVELGDFYDILSDEFEGIMDKGESIVLTIMPTAIGFLMDLEPKSLFYVTVVAFAICTILLSCIPMTVKRIKDMKQPRQGLDEEKSIEMDEIKVKTCAQNNDALVCLEENNEAINEEKGTEIDEVEEKTFHQYNDSVECSEEIEKQKQVIDEEKDAKIDEKKEKICAQYNDEAMCLEELNEKHEGINEGKCTEMDEEDEKTCAQYNNALECFEDVKPQKHDNDENMGTEMDEIQEKTFPQYEDANAKVYKPVKNKNLLRSKSESDLTKRIKTCSCSTLLTFSTDGSHH